MAAAEVGELLQRVLGGGRALHRLVGDVEGLGRGVVALGEAVEQRGLDLGRREAGLVAPQDEAGHPVRALHAGAVGARRQAARQGPRAAAVAGVLVEQAHRVGPLLGSDAREIDALELRHDGLLGRRLAGDDVRSRRGRGVVVALAGGAQRDEREEHQEDRGPGAHEWHRPSEARGQGQRISSRSPRSPGRDRAARASDSAERRCPRPPRAAGGRGLGRRCGRRRRPGRRPRRRRWDRPPVPPASACGASGATQAAWSAVPS